MLGKLRAMRNLFVVVCLSLAAWSRCQLMQPPPLDPATYTSPSGHFSVWINPSTPEGSGKAFYKLTKDGQTVWSKDLPFTLASVAVDDAGRIGGFPRLQMFAGAGAFEVVLMAPDGNVLLHEKHSLSASKYTDTLPDPAGEGVFMDEGNDRMVVVIRDPNWGDFAGSAGLAWWTYSLSTGKPGEIYQPRKNMEKGMVTLQRWQPLPGVPLTLLEWSVSPASAFKWSTIYTLVDAEAKPVWRLDMHDENEAPRTGKRDEEDSGSILSTDPEGRFSLRFLKAAKRVSFQATKAEQEWKVVETGRTDYVRTAKKQSAATLSAPTVKLKLQRKWKIPLGTAKLNPIRDVEAFQFIAAERVAILRGGDQSAVVITSLTGHIERQIPLPPTNYNANERRFLTSTGGSRLIVVSSRLLKNGSAKAWLIDAATGKSTTLSQFRFDSVTGIAGFRDGRFAVIGETDLGSTMTSHIEVFDTKGRRVWGQQGAGYGQSVSEVKFPEDVAVDASQQLLVLNQFATIQVFDEQGKYLRTIDFQKGAGQGAYVTAFTPLKNNSFLVAGLSDLGDGYSHVDRAGKVGTTILPEFSDHKKPSRIDRAAQDPIGRIWMSNGERIYRIGDNGLILGTLGNAVEPTGLTSVRGVAVDPLGRAYIVDGKTAAVYYFDCDGRVAHVGKPLANDYAERPPNVFDIEISRAGDVYVSTGYYYGGLHYSPTGARVAKYSVKGNEGLGMPSSIDPTWRWIETQLVDANGKAVGRLDRWPNLDWMTRGPTAVAPDGSLLAMGSKGERYSSRDPDRIAFFSPTGQPESMSALPPGLGDAFRPAYDGKLVYVVKKDEIIAIDKAGKLLWRFKLPPNPTGSYEVFPSLGGIAVWDGKATVCWYKVP